MKRTTIITLLCTLAVVTIFTATSCQKILPVFRGPDIPPGEGKMWLDAGSGWVDVDEGGIGSSDLWGVPLAASGISEEQLSEQVFADLTGNRVRCAIRFPSKTSPSELRASIRTAALRSFVYPLVKRETFASMALGAMARQLGTSRPELEYQYNYDGTRATHLSSEKSDLREDKDYIYCEYLGLSPSATNMYVLTFDDTMIFFLRRVD